MPIWGIKRRTTPKDLQDLIDGIESIEGVSEEEKEEASEQKPTHVIEVKCSECGFTDFLGYAKE